MARGRQTQTTLVTIVLNPEEIGTAANSFIVNNRLRNLARETQKTYEMCVNSFVGFVGESVNTDKIDSRLFDDYLEYLGSRKISDSTINMYIRHVKRFLNFCIKRKMVQPFDITVPKVDTPLKDPYTKEEMQLLLRLPQSKNWVEWRNWALVNYFYGTGQRLSTVINIKFKDVDFQNNRVKLVWNKDKIQKYMPLSSSVMRVLHQYIMISGGFDENEYLFPQYEGGQLARRSCEDAIKDYNKSRGVDKSSIHLFRHTFAKDYIMAGGNPVKLQKLMNHKTIEMTMNYVNLYSADLADDLDLFNPLDNFNRNSDIKYKRKKVL